MQEIKPHIEANKERYLEELNALLRIPSISADPAYKGDVEKTAQEVADQLKKAGAENVEVCDTAGYPIVYGEKMVDPNAPTILVYGHYDVQPPDPLELWNSPPFEPVIQDEKIYARGSSDDKGQMFMHIKALETMVATNNVPCNIKFMIEGEEEVGSENLGIFVKQNKEKLLADVVLVSDTALLSNETPSITSGLRGLSYVEVEVTGPDRDLHSGIYGGAVANPINVLSNMISSLIDENGHITIEGFYDDVLEVPAEERAQMAKAPFDQNAYNNAISIKEAYGESGFSTPERATIRPTLDVNGIWGGYIGDGAKTVLPSKAHAKISMRLVPNQQSDRITELFTAHFKKIAPPYVSVKVTPHHGGEAFVTPTDFPAYKAASAAMKDTFGKEPIPARSGGSIPIVPMFEKELGIKSLLMGFGLDSDAIHSPNESFGLFNFYKGIETIAHFHHHYAKIKGNANT